MAKHSSLRIMAAVALGCLGVLAFWISRPRPAQSPEPRVPGQETFQDPSNTAGAQTALDENLPIELTNSFTALPSGKASVAVKRTQTTARSVAAPSRPAPSAYTRQLVNNLSNLDQGAIPQTAEQVAAWKQNLQQLVQQGAAAVPAIREFLDKNVDLGFGAQGSQALGYGSARNAMFDALLQIGGPEAAGAMVGTLQTTADPREIALLAKGLEQLAPEQYRQDLLEATRQALAMARDGKLSENDVSPLFEVFSKYGGPGIVAELEQTSGNWKYYSAIALAQLPDGAGVPSLIKMVQDSNGGPVKNVPALEMLAQSASQSPEARTALLDLVRGNNIPGRLWPYLLSVLGGDVVQMDNSGLGGVSDLKTYHIANGNQNFYSAPPPGLAPDQIQQQIGFIDQLLSATSDPSASQTLRAARDSLVKRLPQTVQK